MGGNVEFNGIAATPITSINANIVKDRIYGFIYQINKLSNTIGWENIIAVKHGEMIFSGSSKHFMFHDNFFTHRETCNDIDIQFDETKRDKLVLILDLLLEEGGSLLGYKVSGDTIVTLWRALYTGGNNINVQIDFEAVEFFNGKPTDWFRYFAYSNAKADFESGIKGVFHKLLLRACCAPSVQKLNVKTPKGIVEVEESTLAFSNKYGLRLKFERPIGQNYWNRVKPSESAYIRNPQLIIMTLFPISGPHDHMYSFLQICEIISKQNVDFKKGVYDGFKRILLGPGNQQLYRDIDRDLREKLEIIERLSTLINLPK